MRQIAEPHLTDTNILLRLVKRDHPDFSLVRRAIAILYESRAPLYYSLQNMAEFWNASTRPLERNGFGLSIAETEANAEEIEGIFTLLPDTEEVYREWRRIVFTHEVKGVQVHDAKLIAVLHAYKIRHLLTLNTTDFQRYPDIVIMTPEQLILMSKSNA